MGAGVVGAAWPAQQGAGWRRSRQGSLIGAEAAEQTQAGQGRKADPRSQSATSLLVTPLTERWGQEPG